MGIRVALGATCKDVLWLVLGHGTKMTMIGIVIGLAGAFGLTRFLSNLLFGVSATDPATFIGVSVALTAMGLLASYLLAQRAVKIDPMIALRNE
jgi:putative ABC transport system permease protein